MAETKKSTISASEQPAQEEYVTIRIPRDPKNKEDVVVWVNNRRFLIKRGVPVDVPLSVAKILEAQEAMLETIYDYEQKVQK